MGVLPDDTDNVSLPMLPECYRHAPTARDGIKRYVRRDSQIWRDQGGCRELKFTVASNIAEIAGGADLLQYRFYSLFVVGI